MFWKIFAKAKNSILLGTSSDSQASHLPPQGKADFERANTDHKTKEKFMKKRVFPIISAAVFAIFAAHAVYLFIQKAEKLCTKIVVNPVDGKYYVTAEFAELSPEAIPSIIAAVFIAITFIVLIIRIIHPYLILGIIGSAVASISCGLFLFSDLHYGIYIMFRYVYGVTLSRLPLAVELAVCNGYKLLLILLVMAAEVITFVTILTSVGRRKTLLDILKGKKLSVFGASMCTYDGYSNNTEHNPTIGANKQYYGTPESENVKCRDLTVGETFWGRLIDKYEMTLCVNNSWSGSKILDDNPAAAGWRTRPTELHRADGSEPDLIVSFMGNNDFTKERPAGEITDDLFTRVETEGFVPTTFAEGYAVMLSKITKRYPSAKVFLFNMAWRTEEKSELLIKYNEIIEKCAAHYDAYVVRLTESRMSRTDYANYTCDGKLHPNAEGMAIWAELIEDAFKECFD